MYSILVFPFTLTKDPPVFLNFNEERGPFPFIGFLLLFINYDLEKRKKGVGEKLNAGEQKTLN